MCKQKVLICICSAILAVGVAASNAQSLAQLKPVCIAGYGRSEAAIHLRIFNMFPGTGIDSLNIANRLLSNLIREELAKEKANDSVAYLKACLSNGLKDSMTLSMLSKLASPEEQAKYNPEGVWIIHCKDAVTSVAIDSVVMNVFSGNSPVASGISDKNGNIQVRRIPEGSYFITFFRKAYLPFSLRNVKVPDGRQLYIEILLKKPEVYLFKITPQNVWYFIGGGGIMLLLIIGLLTYIIINYIKKRRKKVRRKNEIEK